MSSEREARKAFIRDRQRMVFTITAVILAVVLVVASLFFTGVIGNGKDSTKAAQAPNHGVLAPCPPLLSEDKDQDGTPQYAKVMNNSDVVVRVLNGTDKSGLGKAVGNALNLRGFSIESLDNYNVDGHLQTVANTQIRFGRNAIPQAYTTLVNFNDAVLVMDDRQDKLIDVIVGNSFDNLISESQVKQTAGVEIEPIQGCSDVNAMTDLPKTDEHTQVDPPQAQDPNANADANADTTDDGTTDGAATDGTTTDDGTTAQ